jgi:hypothetical protein
MEQPGPTKNTKITPGKTNLNIAIPLNPRVCFHYIASLTLLDRDRVKGAPAIFRCTGSNGFQGKTTDSSSLANMPAR